MTTSNDPQGVVRIFSQQPSNGQADLLAAADDWAAQFAGARACGLAPDVLSAPVFVIWEITARCPQNCVYCYNDSPRRVEELSSRRLFQVAEQLIQAKVFTVCVSGGEPATRPEYPELLEYLATSGIQVGTVTSGWRMDEALARKVARFAGTVQVSLDGSRAEIHDAVRRGKHSFEDATRAIRLFVELGVPVNVSFAITRTNADDFPATFRLCRELGVKSLRTQKLAMAGRAKGATDICTDEKTYGAIRQFIAESNASLGMRYIEYGDPTTHIDFGRKFGLCFMARISAEGHLGISPYLSVFFGNLRQENLTDVWPKMKKGWHHPKVSQLLDREISCENEVIVDRMDQSVFI